MCEFFDLKFLEDEVKNLLLVMAPTRDVRQAVCAAFVVRASISSLRDDRHNSVEIRQVAKYLKLGEATKEKEKFVAVVTRFIKTIMEDFLSEDDEEWLVFDEPDGEPNNGKPYFCKIMNFKIEKPITIS